ncbi:MAG: inositol monophosphatase family protein [Ktedonobacteraceae bacterium]
MIRFPSIWDAPATSVSKPDNQHGASFSPVPDDSDTLQKALNAAKIASLKAGKFLKRNQGKVHVLHKKSLRDDLLDADLGAEHIIIDILREAFPSYDILSEETNVVNYGYDHRWIIDPLDGSTNFQHGNPSFGVSISLLINDVTTIGVIYLPRLEEMFTVILGQGAYLNERPIHVSKTANLNDAIVHVGDFAKDGNVRDNLERLQDISRLANSVARVRMIGTAAADLAYIACGRADAHIVHNALPWDIEIGRLLIKEAGGDISFYESETGGYIAVCSNGHIHQSLLDIMPLHEEISPETGCYRHERKPFVTPESTLVTTR